MGLVVRGLSKAFGGELALDNVSLEAPDGKILALLGPNGSGKSTLIGCLSGRLTPDAGSMEVGQIMADRFTPRTAFSAGTAVIYQNLSLIPPLSVADNIFLGSELRHGGRVDRRRQRAEAHELLARLGVTLDPRLLVSSLSPGTKQLVEIAKALRHEPKLLVLDEPTAALGEAEAHLVGERLLQLRESGLAIVYVTHLLGEVFEIADRVTVLRDGRTVLTAEVHGLTPAEVIATISPPTQGAAAAELSAATTGAARPRASAQPVLALSRFSAPGVGPVDLVVRAGEIVGVFGLLGSGRTELVEGLYGTNGLTSGQVFVAGRPFEPRSPTRSLHAGLALVPAERVRQSIFAVMSALDNMLMPHFSRISGRLWRRRNRERTTFGRTASLLRLKPARPQPAAWTFSGGNQQKMVVGRWLASESDAKVLMLDEPTQGIDVGARADLYDLLREFADGDGHGVLFTSSDPEEVQALADHVHVLSRGTVVGLLHRPDIVPTRLLNLAHSVSGRLQDEARHA
jgi:ribose transport system ATP-binding protein